jgi:hypothetical protein
MAGQRLAEFHNESWSVANLAELMAFITRLGEGKGIPAKQNRILNPVK